MLSCCIQIYITRLLFCLSTLSLMYQTNTSREWHNVWLSKVPDKSFHFKKNIKKLPETFLLVRGLCFYFWLLLSVRPTAGIFHFLMRKWISIKETLCGSVFNQGVLFIGAKSKLFSLKLQMYSWASQVRWGRFYIFATCNLLTLDSLKKSFYFKFFSLTIIKWDWLPKMIPKKWQAASSTNWGVL